MDKRKEEEGRASTFKHPKLIYDWNTRKIIEMKRGRSNSVRMQTIIETQLIGWIQKTHMEVDMARNMERNIREEGI